MVRNTSQPVCLATDVVHLEAIRHPNGNKQPAVSLFPQGEIGAWQAAQPGSGGCCTPQRAAFCATRVRATVRHGPVGGEQTSLLFLLNSSLPSLPLPSVLS
ncbi:hypothetical protein V2G26_016104 [Clonostachys chloroleuca]